MADPNGSDEIFPVPRSGFIGTVLMLLSGVILGAAFVVLWLTGVAEMILGLIGIGIALVCLYLLPDSLGPAFKGDALVLSNDGFRYVRAGSRVLGNIPFDNVDAITINERDGGRSLWIRLKDPAAQGSFWMGGQDSMKVIFSQCEYHLVVGQGLPVSTLELATKFQSRCQPA